MDRPKHGFPRTWEEVCNDPLLAELPGRVEINRRGNIELSPHDLSHSKYQTAIQETLKRLMRAGLTLQECPIEAKNSSPVADVIWISRSRDAENSTAFVYKAAPEICAEVRLPSNSRSEMNAKRQEYFEAGAVECWYCNLTGGMTFCGPEGELGPSRLCPNFPTQIKI